MFEAYKREEELPHPCHDIETEMGVNSFTVLRKTITWPSHSTVGWTDLPVWGKNTCVLSEGYRGLGQFWLIASSTLREKSWIRRKGRSQGGDDQRYDNICIISPRETFILKTKQGPSWYPVRNGNDLGNIKIPEIICWGLLPEPIVHFYCFSF